MTIVGEQSSTSVSAAGQPETWAGLIVNTELSWQNWWTYRGHATDYPLQVGDVIQVLVLGYDNGARRLRLSLKRLTQDPAPDFMAQLRSGQRVSGRLRRRYGDGWMILIDPWCVIGNAPSARFDEATAVAGMKVQATVAGINQSTKTVLLRSVTLV